MITPILNSKKRLFDSPSFRTYEHLWVHCSTTPGFRRKDSLLCNAFLMFTPDIMYTCRKEIFSTEGLNANSGQVILSVRVEQVVAFLLPHRPGRADFPHPVPLNPVSLKENCDRFWVSAKAAIG